MKKLVHSILKSAVLRGSATALSIKFGASVVGFTMFALASRYMEPAAFGSLAVIFNAMSFLSVVALCGQETLIVRSWNEYCGSNRPALARGALMFGARVVVFSALVVALAAGLAWTAWDRHASFSLIFAGCAFLFAHSVLQFTGQFSRVAAGVLIGETPREFMWRFIVVIALVLCHPLDIELDAGRFMAICAAAISAAIVFQLSQVVHSIPPAVREAKPDQEIRNWAPRSFRMWFAALMDTTSQYLEVVLIGFVLGPAAAGFYFVATRITNVFAMVTGSISIYATPRISALFYTDAISELQRMLRSLAIISLVLNAACLLVIIVAGKLLLWVFGSVYVSAYAALVVLATGASIGALVGPATHVLLLTGHEGAYSRIMLAVLLVRAALIVGLAPSFGLVGAAIGWSISAVFMALLLIIACRRLVGLDPSLAILLREQRQVSQLQGGSSR